MKKSEIHELLEASSLSPTALAGRTAVVTGAGRGIGAGLAEALARLGAHVVLAEIDAPSGRAAAEAVGAQLGPESSATFVETDVGDEAAIEALLARCGTVDIVVNNAIAVTIGAVGDVPLEDWDRSYRVNLRGPVAFARRTVPGMVARGHGVFVCLSSVGGAYMGAYECLKAAGNELAATLAAELEGTGVFAFSVGPGQVMTPGLEEAVRDLAPMHGMSEDEFLAMHSEHVISVAEAAVGIAATIVLAERFHGSETSSTAGLVAAGIGARSRRPAASVETLPRADADPMKPAQTDDTAAEAALRVRASFVEQVTGWRARGLFERKWMERDFRRHVGASPDEVISDLDALVATLRGGGPGTTAVTARLLTYYDRYEKLARDHTRDPVELQRALDAIAGWRSEIVALERLMTPGPAA
jgi:NAD(P)-dependent dehydrogenase (short-subunit alcohol dehydrogenase family)